MSGEEYVDRSNGDEDAYFVFSDCQHGRHEKCAIHYVGPGAACSCSCHWKKREASRG